MKRTTAKACVAAIIKTPEESPEILWTWQSLAMALEKFYSKGGKVQRKDARKRVEAAIHRHLTASEIAKIVAKQNNKKTRFNPTQAISFYNSEEWRKVRYKALRKHGGKCQLCGRSYKEHGVVIHVDHIKPRSKYPELELDENNLQILCEDCNLGKMARDEIDWR